MRHHLTLNLEGFVLDESTLVNSRILPYVRMVASVLEGRTISREELLATLRRGIRQRSIGRLVSPRVCSALSEPTPAVRAVRMSETVERTSLDLRYQAYRLRNDAAEARLLASIAERGIEQPLSGVDTPQGRLLLDGFKRYRCATKLGIECVPYVSLGEEEARALPA